MRRHHITTVCALVSVLFVLVVPFELLAQSGKTLTDFRGRAYSTEDLERALFPKSEAQKSPMRMRGIAPAQPAPPPERPSAVVPIHFEFNSDKILPAYYPNLDQIGEVLAQHPDARIQVEGHTDNIGSPHYNLALSRRRAESVKQYLVGRFSIPHDRLIVEPKGEDDPIAPNSTSQGRSKNRRVEFVNLGQ